MAKDFTGALKNYQKGTTTEQQEEVKEVVNTSSINDSVTEDLNMESLIEALTNENNKSGSYTLIASNDLFNVLRALATIKRTTIKKLFTEALIDSIKSSSKEDILKALEYKKNYLD